MPKATMTPTAIAKAHRRAQTLKDRHERREAALRAQLEEWFEKYDSNGDGKFSRDELRVLLTEILPDHPPTEENLDYLIERATSMDTVSLKIRGNKNGSVTRHELMKTVMRYKDHIAQQKYLDRVFELYDADGNGSFDPGEVEKLLRAAAPEGVDVDASDVEYMLEACDVNENGLIDRDELQPMMAQWKVLAAERAEAIAAAAAAEAAAEAAQRTAVSSFKRIGGSVFMSIHSFSLDRDSSSGSGGGRKSVLSRALSSRGVGGATKVAHDGSPPSTPTNANVSPESSSASRMAAADGREAAQPAGAPVEAVDAGGGCCAPRTPARVHVE